MRLLLIVMALCLGACAPLQRHDFARICMGVEARVSIYAPSQQAAEKAAGVAFAELARLDAMMSDYRESSEVSEVGRNAGGAWVPVSPELIEVVGLSMEISRDSRGAFDVTAGPLTRAWREARRTGRMPEGLDELRALVDWRAIVIHPGCMRLTRKGMRLDLGGIAKGYAAERAVRVLRRAGCPRALVALAGDVAVGDAPPGERGWRIEVRTASDAEPLGVLLLERAVVSTSGDTEQFVEIEGRRYSHIVDPRTGLGNERRVAATVISPSGAVADATATALCVVSPDGREYVTSTFPGTAAIVIDEQGVHIHGNESAIRWHARPASW